MAKHIYIRASVGPVHCLVETNFYDMRKRDTLTDTAFYSLGYLSNHSLGNCLKDIMTGREHELLMIS